MKYGIIRMVSSITNMPLPGKKRSRVGSLSEKPVRGLLCAGQEGCWQRMDVCSEGTHIPPSQWEELPCERHLPWMSGVCTPPFTVSRGLVQPGEAEVPRLSCHIWAHLMLDPQLGSTAGWVNGLDQQVQNPLYGKFALNGVLGALPLFSQYT